MTILPGHKREGTSNLVCRLNKFIYGLKQEIGMENSHFLTSYNFKVSGSDSSLFTRHNTNRTTVILFYIDDIIITGNNSMEIVCVKNDLKQKFEIKIFSWDRNFPFIKIAIYISKKIHTRST
jgi:Reverse transcriptase (RNA-dependent DNA polymerase)